MKQFRTRIIVCLLPCLVAAIFVGLAWYRYQNGLPGAFKLGVDLVGGTILVYEVDVDKFTDEKQLDDFKPEELAASLKRRIDPTDLYNVVIRPVSKTRVEIILPTGGAHQEQTDRENWAKLLAAVRQQWPQLAKAPLEDVGRGDELRLAAVIEEQLKDQKVPAEQITGFIQSEYGAAGQQRNLSDEEISRIKDLIGNVGNLEFRILANEQDDREAMDAARNYFAGLDKLPPAEKEKRLQELQNRALRGQPPPGPTTADGIDSFDWKTPHASGKARYSWVELGRRERAELGLNNESGKNAAANSAWKTAEDARARNFTFQLSPQSPLYYSRACLDRTLNPEQREQKKFEYFVLTRDPPPDEQVTGQYLVNAHGRDTDEQGRPAVHFTFNNTGGNLFHALTSANKPSGPDGEFQRRLAIILDNLIMQAPTIRSPIRTDGQISGMKSQKEVESLVRILKSGALPASLKKTPVSESTIGPTLGADTIRAGTQAIAIAFIAVLFFMVIYYRFAGLVACVALFANLLLTIGFMVAVNATFTLPGLAGIVLMLALAVDANVLIYERLREERDRGASLNLAIRNGYDRAFPTIIDTHLTSILTAIILYAVGNDQLKGFGVSLTVGLIISLFTALYMTRLMFDIWNYQGWLNKLSMLRLLSKTQIDFMSIRQYCFTATVLFSLFGAAFFLYRGDKLLNIDFVGGTAYGGQLEKPIDATTLRQLLADSSYVEKTLAVKDVKQLDSDGFRFAIVYQGGGEQRVRLTNRATPEEVRQRASLLPDPSVEQIFLSNVVAQDPESRGMSRYFTVRTSEMAPDLVLVSVNRLLEKGGHPLKQVEMTAIKPDGSRAAYLTFDGFASPGHLKLLLEVLFKDELDRKLQGKEAQVTRAVEVIGGTTEAGKFVAGRQPPLDPGQPPPPEGQFKEMRVEMSEGAAAYISSQEFESILQKARDEFANRPQPMRLENFDKALAAESQRSATYAIILSWMVILGYLWFRFGSWTFGLSAVLCLVHDLLFTLGIVAICHYLSVVPVLSDLLLLQDFKLDFPAVAALLTLVGYSVNDTIVVFDRIREVRGKNPELTPEMINDSINQTLSRTLLTSFITFLTVFVLYVWGGDGIHLFAFIMVIGVVVGTYSSIYVASPLLLIFKEGTTTAAKEKPPAPEPEEPEGEEEEREEAEA